MKTDKGTRAPRWLAAYLNKWWPGAEATGSGRHGSDIQGTPGIVWEMKTPAEFKPAKFVRQAEAYSRGALPVTVYLPVGCGEQSIENALAILPVHRLIDLLIDAGYTGQRETPGT